MKPRYSSKKNSVRFNQTPFKGKAEWPAPTNRRGQDAQAPRVAGNFGRCVRNEQGEIVTVTRAPVTVGVAA